MKKNQDGACLLKIDCDIKNKNKNDKRTRRQFSKSVREDI